MIGEFEAEKVWGLADVVPVHQQALGLIDDVIVDVSDGCAACGLVDDVAEVARRIGQLGSAVGNGGQTMPQLAILAEILLEQGMESFQQVIAAFVLFGKLALIDAIAVFEYQAKIAQKDAPERGWIFMIDHFLTHLGK